MFWVLECSESSKFLIFLMKFRWWSTKFHETIKDGSQKMPQMAEYTENSIDFIAIYAIFPLIRHKVKKKKKKKTKNANFIYLNLYLFNILLHFVAVLRL